MENFGPFVAFLKLVFVFAAGVLAAKLFLAFTMWLIATALIMLGLAGGFFGAVILTFFGIVFGIMSILAFFVGCNLGAVALALISKGVTWIRSVFDKEEKTDEFVATPEAASAA